MLPQPPMSTAACRGPSSNASPCTEWPGRGSAAQDRARMRTRAIAGAKRKRIQLTRKPVERCCVNASVPGNLKQAAALSIRQQFLIQRMRLLSDSVPRKMLLRALAPCRRHALAKLRIAHDAIDRRGQVARVLLRV